jgi:DNA-binding NarL/FixJ family response regulator
MIDEIRMICIAPGAKPAIASADALAAKLAATRASAPAFPTELSPREAEVLRLITQGHTRTNSANRTEAALFAREHGLA